MGAKFGTWLSSHLILRLSSAAPRLSTATPSISTARGYVSGASTPLRAARPVCVEETYRCGQEAANYLDRLVGENTVTCEPRGRPDRYRRIVAVCSISAGPCLDQHCATRIELADMLVLDGQALDYPRYSAGAYARLQAHVQTHRRGMWAGEFERPWDWKGR